MPTIFLTSEYFLSFLAGPLVALWSKPIGHAQPHIALPVRVPKNPKIKIGYKS